MFGFQKPTGKVRKSSLFTVQLDLCNKSSHLSEAHKPSSYLTYFLACLLAKRQRYLCSLVSRHGNEKEDRVCTHVLKSSSKA